MPVGTARAVRHARRVRVVLAPDGFGGTLSAAAAARAMAEGWSSGAPDDELRLVPLSDGGPDLVEVLQTALPGAEVVERVVEDALGRPVPARLLLSGDTAYVESALACGLHLLRAEERDPRRTSTYGVGQLVSAALDAGARRVVVGLGGSATNDGGAGLLAALGLVPVDRDGRALPRGGAALAQVAALAGEVDPRLAGVELVSATDVDAPLLGPRGASAVFGPQKGASADDVRLLDAALARWADVLEARTGSAPQDRALRDRPGAGAAGGLGAALSALGARREAGIALVREAVRLDDRIAAADLVLTGEGRFDATSLTGKVVSGVAQAASAAAVPCVVLAGQVAIGRQEAAAHGIAEAHGVADAVGLAASLADPAGELSRLAARVARSWSPSASR